MLPAETLAAVTAAMGALGRPYAPGTAGPDSWDCGSLVSTVYGGAGIALPADQAELFAVTTPIEPADVLPGDLVFLGDAESGLGHVGIALDQQTMLAADARAGAVVARTLPADEVLSIGRPSLGQRAPEAAPGPTGGALNVECGNTVYPPSFDGARQWGGYPNGLIPPSAMCPLGVGDHRLRCDAAAAYRAMSAAFAGAFGSPICITDSYRTYASQVRLYGQKPALAAVPGTSNHGWGLAVDLCGGIEHYGTPQYTWLKANAGRFGFLHPDWAEPGTVARSPGTGSTPAPELVSGAIGPELSVAAPTVRTTHGGEDMLIDCDTCTARGTGCGDCVVTVLLGAPPSWRGSDPVVVPMTARARATIPGAATGTGPAAAEDVVVPPPGVVVEFDEVERRAVRALADVGLVPPLRHRGQAADGPGDATGHGRRTG